MIKNKIEDNCNDDDTYTIGTIIGCILITMVLTVMVLGFCGAFDDPYIELGIDKDKLAYQYVTEQYPEYKNCRIEYIPEGLNYEKVNIFCDNSNPEGKYIYFKDDEKLQSLDKYFNKKLEEETNQDTQIIGNEYIGSVGQDKYTGEYLTKDGNKIHFVKTYEECVITTKQPEPCAELYQ